MANIGGIILYRCSINKMSDIVICIILGTYVNMYVDCIRGLTLRPCVLFVHFIHTVISDYSVPVLCHFLRMVRADSEYPKDVIIQMTLSCQLSSVYLRSPCHPQDFERKFKDGKFIRFSKFKGWKR